MNRINLKIILLRIILIVVVGSLDLQSASNHRFNNPKPNHKQNNQKTYPNSYSNPTFNYQFIYPKSNQNYTFNSNFNSNFDTNNIFNHNPNTKLSHKQSPLKQSLAFYLPTFGASSWGECGVSCGRGVQRRVVVCVVVGEDGQQKELPFDQCSGPPLENERECNIQDCLSNSSLNQPSSPLLPSHPFSSQLPSSHQHPSHQPRWELIDYSPCSTTCGAGVKKAFYGCYNDTDNIADVECSKLQQPQSPLDQPCFLTACPPNWVTIYSGPCTASCGSGMSELKYSCLQNHERNRIEIHNSQKCPPLPPSHVPCEVQVCTPEWLPMPWGKCSVTCGEGYQSRIILCRQKISQSLTINKPDVDCIKSQGDNELRIRTCKKIKCSLVNKERRKFVFKNVIQLSEKKHINILAGDNGTFIIGTSISIHCPLQTNSKFTKKWFKNGKLITKKNRLRGKYLEMLKIRRGRDGNTGVYTCSDERRRRHSVVKFQSFEDVEEWMYKTRINHINYDLPFQLPAHTTFHSSRLPTKRLISRKTFSKFLIKHSLILQYLVSEWSDCSVSCGGGGSRSREIMCALLLSDVVLVLDLRMCSTRRLRMPMESADCELEDCPVWWSGEWSECKEDECVAVHTSMKVRRVECIGEYQKKVDETHCPSQSKPLEQRPCRYNKCTPKWKIISWTKCKAFQGELGLQGSRSKCMVGRKATVKASHCKHLHKHRKKRHCLIDHKKSKVCKDNSEFCPDIPRLNLCTYPQYLRQCCLSCHLSQYSNIHTK